MRRSISSPFIWMLRRRASTPFESSCATAEPLAERVVEQDAPALLGEEAREVRDELGQAARRAVAARAPSRALTGKTTGSFTSVDELVLRVGERLALLVRARAGPTW